MFAIAVWLCGKLGATLFKIHVNNSTFQFNLSQSFSFFLPEISKQVKLFQLSSLACGVSKRSAMAFLQAPLQIREEEVEAAQW